MQQQLPFKLITETTLISPCNLLQTNTPLFGHILYFLEAKAMVWSVQLVNCCKDNNPRLNCWVQYCWLSAIWISVTLPRYTNTLIQWFSNFLHQVPPQKIFGFPSTTIMTNIKMQYKWLPTAPGVCSRCVCVHCCVCVHFGRVKCRAQILSMSLSLSVTLYTVKKKKLQKKRVRFNPYKDIYYCQPLKI